MPPELTGFDIMLNGADGAAIEAGDPLEFTINFDTEGDGPYVGAMAVILDANNDWVLDEEDHLMTEDGATLIVDNGEEDENPDIGVFSLTLDPEAAVGSEDIEELLWLLVQNSQYAFVEYDPETDDMGDVAGLSIGSCAGCDGANAIQGNTSPATDDLFVVAYPYSTDYYYYYESVPFLALTVEDGTYHMDVSGPGMYNVWVDDILEIAPELNIDYYFEEVEVDGVATLDFEFNELNANIYGRVTDGSNGEGLEDVWMDFYAYPYDDEYYWAFTGWEGINPTHEVFTWGHSTLDMVDGEYDEYELLWVQGDEWENGWSGAGFNITEPVDLAEEWDRATIHFDMKVTNPDGSDDAPTISFQFESGEDGKVRYFLDPNDDGDWGHYHLYLGDFVNIDGTENFDPSSITVFQFMAEANAVIGREVLFRTIDTFTDGFSYSTSTDENGDYDIWLDGGFDYNVWIYSDSGYFHHDDYFFVDEGADIEYNVVLEPTGPQNVTVSGYVTDAQTGEPLVNAQVNAYLNNANFSSWTNTDESGYYEHTLIAGDYWTSAYMDGYHSSNSQKSFESGGNYSVDYGLWHNDVPIANLQVWVQDHDTGDELENATIYLIGPSGNGVLILSGVNGYANIQVPGDSLYTVWAWDGEHLSKDDEIFMDAYGWYGLGFGLGSFENYAGAAFYVYDAETGETLEDAWVYGDPSIHGEDRIGQNGIGTLHMGPGGENTLVNDWYMEAWAEGYETQYLTSDDSTDILSAGSWTYFSYYLDPEPGNAVFEGSVTDLDGAPIDSGFVMAQNDSLFYGGDIFGGSYTLEVMPENMYILQAVSSGFWWDHYYPVWAPMEGDIHYHDLHLADTLSHGAVFVKLLETDE